MAAIFPEQLAIYGVPPVADRVRPDSPRGETRYFATGLVSSNGTKCGGGIDLLQRNSNCDAPIDIEKLGSPVESQWNDITDGAAEGHLVFMVGNQAVCIWAVQLDGSDAPSVVVARDSDLEWRPCVETFSTFIACQVWNLWNGAICAHHSGAMTSTTTT